MLDMEQFHGRLNDVDHHLQPAVEDYEEVGGEAGRQVAKGLRDRYGHQPEEAELKVNHLLGQESSAFTSEAVWKMKGASAPGAYSSEGRLKTLDVMGVRRALIFADPAIMMYALAPTELGVPTMRHWNDFAVSYNERDRDRLRVAGLLNTWDIDIAAAEVERMLKAGAQAFVLASSVAPGDRSPADPGMDPIWAMLAEANVPALLHIGGERGFMASDGWPRGVPALEFEAIPFTEGINAYVFSTFHLAPQHFISMLVLGGVFERFPNLRFGAIEVGSGWLGPLAERLDVIVNLYARRFAPVLSMKPSEYVRRNIRVTPFYFEPVALYIERHGLEECYCYSSDFPHPEGGFAPIEDFNKEISRLGQTTAEKFFVSNAEWLLPALA
jgi:predicted TIM-barrel fold metal-dependent hydrolase